MGKGEHAGDSRTSQAVTAGSQRRRTRRQGPRRGAEAPGSGPAREGGHAGPSSAGSGVSAASPCPARLDPPVSRALLTPPAPHGPRKSPRCAVSIRCHSERGGSGSNTHPLRLRRVAAGTAPWHRTAASNGEPLTRAAASGAETQESVRQVNAGLPR